MSAILGIHPPQIIHDASHGSASRAAINEGIINNYMTEFQRNAVDGVLHTAIPEGHHRMMGGEVPSNRPEPAMLTTKASPTKSSPGHVHFPGASGKYHRK